jgi:hypothetical protein
VLSQMGVDATTAADWLDDSESVTYEPPPNPSLSQLRAAAHPPAALTSPTVCQGTLGSPKPKQAPDRLLICSVLRGDSVLSGLRARLRKAQEVEGRGSSRG